MSNREVNQLRARINRIRKTAQGTQAACQQIIDDCTDVNTVLDDIVSNNLWGAKPATERPARKTAAVRGSRGMTEDDVLALLKRVFGVEVPK